MILSNQGNPKKAIETFDEVLPVFRKHVGNKSVEVATVLRNRGLCQMKLSEYDAALRDYQTALEIVDTIGKPTLDQRLQILLNITQVYRLQGKQDRANETKKLALSVLDRKKPDQEKWIKKFEELPASGKVEERKP
jgi:tetratricopeptide (TPR) repeat protein